MSAPNSDSNHETSSDEDIEHRTRDGILHEPSQSSELLDPQSPSTASADDAERTTLDQGQVQTDRVVPTLMDNPYADEPTYFTRPNRYFGPDSTWESWTAEERDVVQRLADVRREDLSLHLFNAYWLRRNYDRRHIQSSKKGKGKGPISATEDEVVVDEEGNQRWPPRSWTSWPLHPSQVPREEDDLGIDSGGRHNSRPSAMLEECLIATTTRFARERWKSRAWQPDTPPKRDMKVEHDEEDISMTDYRDFPDHQEETPESDAAETFNTEPESDGDSPGFLSQVWPLPGDMKPNVKLEDESYSDEEQTPRPVPMADDDLVRSIVLPSTRHVLSKLDDLLLGLHKTRQAYAVPKLSGDSDDSEKSTIDAETSRSRSRSRAQYHSTSRSRKRKHSNSDYGPSSSNLANGRRDLNPRDWSDVIGMAYLTGWDAAVVDRAAARCAHLFDENMLFRTFTSGDAATATKSSYDEYHAVTPRSPSSDSDSDRDADKADDTKSSDLRTSKACTYCRIRQQACAASVSNSKICQRCLDDNIECSGITTTRMPPYRRKTCPYTGCDRRHKPFKKIWHLQRHIDTVHDASRPQGIDRFPSSPLPPSRSDPDLTTGSPHRMVCPVSDCTRHSHSFGRANRLYEHIRKMHPDIDVEAVKKLETKKRGERRGRYRDEGRRREVARQNRSRGRRAPVGQSSEVDSVSEVGASDSEDESEE